MVTSRFFAFLLFVMSILVGSSAQAGPPVLLREDIKTFSKDATKLAKLREAVAALQARGLDNSTSWLTMAGIHEIRSADPALGSVPAPIQALFHQCHSREQLFFLWHRAYVAALEHLLQDAINDPDFRLPYWNWYADPSLPEAFRNEFLDPQKKQKNPLYVQNRNPRINDGNPIWKPQILTDFKEDDFSVFQDQLNLNEHGDVHGLVGTLTNMGSIRYAARDPIFYLHHANIDRLLMVWLKINPTAHQVPASFPDWQPGTYRFPVPPATTGTMTPNVNTPTVQQLALGDMEAMGYKYDNVDTPTVTPPPTVPILPPLIAVAPPKPPLPDDHLKMQIFTATPKEIEIGPGGTVQLSIQSDLRPKLLSLVELPPGAARTAGLTLVFENIHIKELPPGLASYRVFVNLPTDRSVKANFRDHFVGTLSLFSLQHTAEHDHSTVRLRLSKQSGATGLKQALATSSEGTTKVNVSLVPVLAPDAKPPQSAVLSIGQIRLEGSDQSAEPR